MIPPLLVFTYAIAGRKYILSLMSFICMILSVAAVIGSLGFVWWIQVRAVPLPSSLSRLLSCVLCAQTFQGLQEPCTWCAMAFGPGSHRA